ncbi:SixA phosphatase family protein [Paracoccaceae bacterium GXU_MW_L88]
MKRLILMRHAKSDWSAGLEDHERPLNPRGREAAPRMAAWLKAEGLIPDAALISDSERTTETFARMQPELGAIPVTKDATLYLASPDQMLQTIQTRGTGDTLLIVAHQPGTGLLAHRLDSDAPEDIPTAAVLVFDHDGEWQGLSRATLTHYQTPKKLPKT